MSRLDYYIARQVLIATVAVLLTLTGAVWLTQSLRFIDLTVNRGLPVSTFMELSALVLPNFVTVILPVALFAATLFTYAKMQGDSELVVVRAAGISPLRIMRPALTIAALVVAIGYLMTLWVLPTSYRAFKDLQTEIRGNYSSVLLQEGVFVTVDRGLTLFIREQGGRGELRGIMVHDDRNPQRPSTYIAESGAIVTGPDGPRLVMVNGNRQELDRETRRVSFLYFERYTVDIERTQGGPGGPRTREATERYLDELWSPDDVTDPRQRRAMRAEAHQRLATPLYALAFTLIALTAALAGDFSRRGQTWRIVGAVALAAGLQALAFGVGNLAVRNPAMIPMVYLNALIPILACLYISTVQIRRFGPARPAIAAQG